MNLEDKSSRAFTTQRKENLVIYPFLNVKRGSLTEKIRV